VKYRDVHTYLQVFSGEVYFFEVRGEEGAVIDALTRLEERRAFGVDWEAVDVKVGEVKVGEVRAFELDLTTPVLLVSPRRKEKRKLFTNWPSVVFFSNVVDVTGTKRGDGMLEEALRELDEALWEEPSTMSYAKVIYAGKEVVGLMGKLRYSVVDRKVTSLLSMVLESVVAKGIGSSKRNGFGRVSLKVLA
jgi:CRISPR-associated endoribonuclease Cas6